MATYHMSIKSGKKGKAGEHAAYIGRIGKHGKYGNQDLVAAGHGNLPDWANNDPGMFWRMADKHERCNGAAYREFELALPGELTQEQNVTLLQDFIVSVLPGKPYQYAILHQPIAALGGVPQPHGHLMFSDRRSDEHDRSPQQHFRRHNPKTPEKGGCKKDSGGRDRVTLRTELIATREKWAELQNAALEAYGHHARVDWRSNKDQGIERQPERHLGQAGIKNMTQVERDEYASRRGAPCILHAHP